MRNTVHERPGVYSSYDASSLLTGGGAKRIIGAAAIAAKGTPGQVVSLTSYAAGVAAFGADENAAGMSTLLRLLFAGGASTVLAVAVAEAGALSDYQAAFNALAEEDAVQLMVCDSGDAAVHQALRDSVLSASQCRRERIAVVGGDNKSAAELVEHAGKLNCERVILVGGDVVDSQGTPLPGVFGAAAVAAAIASERDPAAPLNGAPLRGLGGVSVNYGDNDIDLLVRGGVTPLECTAGVVSPVRGITTRTTTAGAADATWRESTTILIMDDVIPAVRTALRSKFTRSKNTVQTRSAIRSQVIVELESRMRAEIIDSYGDVTVQPDPADPTVCLVEFGFVVAHGLNQVLLTAHITV